MIKGIVFDLDGVYFIKGKERFSQYLEKIGIDFYEIRRVFFNSDEMNKYYKKGKWTDEQFWPWAKDQWHIDQNINLVEKFIEGYETNPEIVKLVETVRAKGYKTLICSNNFPARINGLEQKFGFLKNFDTVILSYEVGETKPSEIIFNELIKRSGLKPEEILFIDDRSENIAAAKSLGLTAIHYKPYIELSKQLNIVLP